MKHMWIPAAVFALLAGIAVYFALRAASAQNAEPVAAAVSGGTVTVVETTAAIPAHTAITGDMVKLVKLPASAAMADAAHSLPEVVGRVSDVAFVKGEQVLLQRLVPTASIGTGSRLDAVIPKGMRAITIAVSDTTGLSGLIEPGDTVDLITAGNVRNSAGSVVAMASFMLLQNVRVLACGQNLDGATRAGYSNITVCLSLNDAGTINTVVAAGYKIQVLMRAPGDSKPMPTSKYQFNT